MNSIRAFRSGSLLAWTLGFFLLAGCSTASDTVSTTVAASGISPVITGSPSDISAAPTSPGQSAPTQAAPSQVSPAAPTPPPVPTALPPAVATESSPAIDAGPGITVPATPSTTPSSITAEAIGLEEPLIQLGLLADGTAETPTDYDDVGWFSGGGRPGGFGPTVLLGHVDSLDGPAVFYRLRELTPGDLVTVTLSDGTSASYSVTDNSSYEKADFPTFTVFGATPKDVLHLVTCGGAFDQDALSYESNIVITAERLPA